MTMKSKSYSELILLPTLEERLDYLRLNGHIGEQTFGVDRYLNQMIYSSSQWKSFRRQIIIRDAGCDLALPDWEIHGNIYIHHINPLTVDDVLNDSPLIYDPDNAVCCSYDMHYAIHYGKKEDINRFIPVERKPNDTCPWKG